MIVIANFSSGDSGRRRLSDEDDNDISFQLLSSFFILISLNLVPFLIPYVFHRYRDTLKEETTRKKIGSLYQTVEPEHNSSKSYPFVFLIRRSIFVLITFSLFIYPALQVQIQLASILLYIAYTQYAL